MVFDVDTLVFSQAFFILQMKKNPTPLPGKVPADVHVVKR
jgi:hypothetical protein